MQHGGHHMGQEQLDNRMIGGWMIQRAIIRRQHLYIWNNRLALSYIVLSSEDSINKE